MGIALLRGDWKKRFGDNKDIITVDKELKVNDVIKYAETDFQLLESSSSSSAPNISARCDNKRLFRHSSACSLVVCTPKTGRTHQIRRHAYSIGFPIIGDTEHGDSTVNRWWRENR